MGGAYSQPRDVKSRLFPAFATALPSQAGRVVAVTGSTSGTGFVAARTCAKLGAHVLLLNRPSARSEAALKAIAEDAPGGVFAIDCDLQSFASVRAAAVAVKAAVGEQGLDVLCCNAGVMALRDAATADGHDVQMQTNHLSHFLLAKELQPLLEKAAALRGARARWTMAEAMLESSEPVMNTLPKADMRSLCGAVPAAATTTSPATAPPSQRRSECRSTVNEPAGMPR
jgi:NAD(P)-dependent dehydrogenase (short-subunit alcohol dehydrogenase family)